MKKLFSLFLLIFLGSQLIEAECGNVTRSKYIYLWDVTLSMKGYVTHAGSDTTWDRSKDIHKNVVDFLVRDINAIKDQNTTIVVCPYQADRGVLDVWEKRATDDGKASMVNIITRYRNNQVTWTNIVGAIQYAKNHLIDPNCLNRLVILTDGEQKTGNPAKDARDFDEAIRNWKLYAPEHNSYALYVTVGEDAPVPEVVTSDKTGAISVIDHTDTGKQISIVDLCPQNIRLCLNDLDERKDTILFSVFKQYQDVDMAGVEPVINIEISDKMGLLKKKSFSLPLTNSKLSIPIEFNYTGNELRNSLPQNDEVYLPVNITSMEFNNPDYKLILQEWKFSIVLVNKPEPKLTIRFK